MALLDVLLTRRFGALPALISQTLDKHDPLDLVYADNPDEYVDVVREFFVNAQGVGSSDSKSLLEALALSFDSCFGEEVGVSKLAPIVAEIGLMDLERLRGR